MYALHFLLPFLVAGCVCIHLALLHIMGSGTASTVPGTTVDGEAFLMYYYKDGVLGEYISTAVVPQLDIASWMPYQMWYHEHSSVASSADGIWDVCYSLSRARAKVL